jgi:uncharacterized membrane protein
MKKYFITGLITLLPFALTVFLVIYLVDLMTGPFVGFVEELIISFEVKRGVVLTNHDFIVLFLSRLITIVFLVVFIFFLGFCARKFFFNFLINQANKIFSRIPIIKSVYRLTKDVTQAIFTQKEKTFKRTVLIPFPSSETHAFGLVTGEVPSSIKKILDEVDLSVFVPTSPHPISGFLLLTPKKLAKSVDVNTEDVFKFLISCGVREPGSPSSEPQK